MKSKNLHVGEFAATSRKTRIAAWLPVVLWAAVIAGLSAVPGGVYPRTADAINTAAHLALFAVLGALCARGLRSSHAPTLTRTHAPTAVLRPRAIVALSTALAALYGVSDELHQMFVPRRSPEIGDLVADTIGGFAGALAFVSIARQRRR